MFVKCASFLVFLLEYCVKWEHHRILSVVTEFSKFHIVFIQHPAVFHPDLCMVSPYRTVTFF